MLHGLLTDMLETKYAPQHTKVAKRLGGYQAIVDRFVSMHLRRAHLPTMLHKLCRYVLWTRSGFAVIRDQHSAIVPLHLNPIQVRICAVMMLQAARRQPIRIVVLKARKGGTTTLIESIAFQFSAHYPMQVATMMAHVASSTIDIFEIARLMAESYAGGATRNREALYFPQARSRYSCRTAGGTGAGAGGTPTILHLSEVALMVPRVQKELYASLGSVPDNPDTIVVHESTARGRERFFSTFDKAHRPSNVYEPIFIPWFLDNRLTAPCDREFARTDDEVDLAAHAAEHYGVELTNGMLQWRRLKIDDLGGAVFKQEFPATPEEAIEGHKGLILPGMRSCIISRLPFNPRLLQDVDRGGAIDFGYADPTVIVTGFYVDQFIYISEIYGASRKLGAEHAAHIRYGHTYYCDPSALQARMEIEEAMQEQAISASLVPCPRIHDPGGGSNDAEWELVRKMIRHGRLQVLESASEQLLLESDNFAVNEKTGKPNDTRNPGVWNHFDTLDAVRYFVVGTMSGAEVGSVTMSRG